MTTVSSLVTHTLSGANRYSDQSALRFIHSSGSNRPSSFGTFLLGDTELVSTELLRSSGIVSSASTVNLGAAELREHTEDCGEGTERQGWCDACIYGDAASYANAFATHTMGRRAAACLVVVEV